MTAVSPDGVAWEDDLDVVRDVAALLRDRVPGEVLARVSALLAGADLTPDPPGEDLRRLLQTGADGIALRHRLGAAGGRWLVGVRGDHFAAGRLLREAASTGRRAAGCRADRTTWLLVAAPAQGWVTRAVAAEPALVGARVALDDVARAPSCRVVVDDLLDVAVRREWRGLVDAAELGADRRLDLVADLAERLPPVSSARLSVLRRSPQGFLVDTLASWFEHDRDAQRTAEALHLHVNTVRYRLRRAQELLGLDLARWDDRLAAELQLRLGR